MAAPISATVREAMRARAQQVKDNIAKGQSGAFTRMWALHGKNAIVAAGQEIVLRLMPRWDRYVAQNGKVTSSAAALELPIYVPAFEHWWDNSEGKRVREWCPVIAGPDGSLEGDCPICEAAAELRTSSAADDKTLAKEIKAREVVLFNAMLGPLGARSFNEGKPDIRPMAVPGTVFLAISDIMTGGEQESFARGDVSDPGEGYDLKLSRPSGQGDRWKVDCAPQPSRLFAPAEAANWKGWWEMIPNLDEMLEKETKTYEELHQLFHEIKAAPAAGRGAAPATAPAIPADDPAMMGAGPEAPTGEEVGDLDLEGLDDMPGSAPTPPPARAGAATKREAAPPSPVPGRRGTGRGRR